MTVINLQPIRYRLVHRADGFYTEIWVDGLYTRIQAAFSREQAIQAVRMSRQRFTFKE